MRCGDGSQQDRYQGGLAVDRRRDRLPRPRLIGHRYGVTADTTLCLGALHDGALNVLQRAIPPHLAALHRPLSPPDKRVWLTSTPTRVPRPWPWCDRDAGRLSAHPRPFQARPRTRLEPRFLRPSGVDRGVTPCGPHPALPAPEGCNPGLDRLPRRAHAHAQALRDGPEGRSHEGRSLIPGLGVLRPWPATSCCSRPAPARSA
jgi:hypothetical protein